MICLKYPLDVVKVENLNFKVEAPPHHILKYENQSYFFLVTCLLSITWSSRKKFTGLWIQWRNRETLLSALMISPSFSFRALYQLFLYKEEFKSMCYLFWYVFFIKVSF